MKAIALAGLLLLLPLSVFSDDLTSLTGTFACSTASGTCGATLSAPVIPSGLRDSGSSFLVTINNGLYSTTGGPNGYGFSPALPPPANVIDSFGVSFTFTNWNGTSPLVIPGGVIWDWYDGTHNYLHTTDAVLDSFDGRNLTGHFSWTSVPEPSSIILLVTGCGLVARRLMQTAKRRSRV